MSQARIKARIAARKAAADIVSMLEWEDGTGADYADSLMKELMELLPIKKVDVVVPEKAEPIARLGSIRLRYGSHIGKSYDETPLNYLDWLCRENEASVKNLKAYLTHPELAARRGAER